jgi:hypothetical protein
MRRTSRGVGSKSLGIPPFRGAPARRSLERVTTYLIETYVAGGDMADLEDRARAAARAMSNEGHAVRYLRSVLVRVDETCFYFFEAASQGVAIELARRAGLRYERVVEAEMHCSGDAEHVAVSPATQPQERKWST